MSDWETIHQSLMRIEDKQDVMASEITEIRVSQAVHKERITLLQRIVYGAVGVILLAVIWAGLTEIIPASQAREIHIEEKM